MSATSITNEISERICSHMNNDHQEALLSYARHYGGYKNPKKALMVKITCEAMSLDVDSQIISIPFENHLTDREDAHQTLIKMLKAIPK